MANTYFVSSLTDTQIESVLAGLYRLQTQENNGKTVGIVNGVLGVITGGGGGERCPRSSGSTLFRFDQWEATWPATAEEYIPL